MDSIARVLSSDQSTIQWLCSEPKLDLVSTSGAHVSNMGMFITNSRDRNIIVANIVVLNRMIQHCLRAPKGCMFFPGDPKRGIVWHVRDHISGG